MSDVTTTRNGFRVEDITFKNARRQCEIDSELDHIEESEEEVRVPTHLTPEQVKEFYKTKISLCKDSNEKRVYSQTIKWIDEMLEVRKKLFALESKEVESNDGTPSDDIE